MYCTWKNTKCRKSKTIISPLKNRPHSIYGWPLRPFPNAFHWLLFWHIYHFCCNTTPDSFPLIIVLNGKMQGNLIKETFTFIRCLVSRWWGLFQAQQMDFLNLKLYFVFIYTYLFCCTEMRWMFISSTAISVTDRLRYLFSCIFELELNLLKNLIFLEINWAWELTDVNPTFMRRNRLNPQLCGHFCSYIESYENKFG